MGQVYRGSCLCGGLSFSVSAFSPRVANCYCTMCRKFHGAPFGTLTGVSGLTWLTGEALLKKYKAPNGTQRYFCGTCGSSIGFLSKGQPESAIELAISAFDTDIPIKPDAHIYTGYKVGWYTINDDLPAFAEGRE